MTTLQETKKVNKFEPFIKQHLGACYAEVPFDDLEISTATMDVRMHERTALRYDHLFFDLPVVEREVYEEYQDRKWPAGTIYAAKFEAQVRGTSPTSEGVAFKNSTMIWMWLEDKPVNIKISSNNLHITGCKKIEQAAECMRLLQLHIQVLMSAELGPLPDQPVEPSKYYAFWPYALRFDVCMINYNFKLGVALDLPKFDLYVFKHHNRFVFSSYDQNINFTSMPMKCPMLGITYTINDNGKISMCTSESDIEVSYDNLLHGYEAFYVMVKNFREASQICH